MHTHALTLLKELLQLSCVSHLFRSPVCYHAYLTHFEMSSPPIASSAAYQHIQKPPRYLDYSCLFSSPVKLHLVRAGLCSCTVNGREVAYCEWERDWLGAA